MSAEWKVGTVRGVSLVFWDGESWRWADNGRPCYEQPPTDLRPLVLIDPGDLEQVERLMALYYDDRPSSLLVDDMQAALREYASPTPPKPDEPMGLGAVVVDADDNKWVRADVEAEDDPPWVKRDGTWGWYADIAAVEVLSAGVES